MDPFFVAAAAVAATACVTDLKTGTIPNRLTLPVLAVAPLARMAYAKHAGLPADDVVFEGALSVVGALVSASVPATLYRKSAIGAGDVKLFAALGALAHPSLGLEILSFSFVVAIVLAPISLLYQGTFARTLGNLVTLAANLVRPAHARREVPAAAMTWLKMGPAVFVGTLVALGLDVSGGAS